jgi:periplasmic nitrate reductase NapD
MGDIHIAGCVAYVRPEAAEAIVRTITSTGLAEVPQRDDNGHLVVLIEAGSAGKVMDVIDAIRALEGVLAVHLAYQHAEPESDMELSQ